MVSFYSGGCGAMYSMEVESPLFRGLTMVKQHRLVNEALKDEIGDMHGLTIKTRPTPEV
jgi:stress-induced morphogen